MYNQLRLYKLQILYTQSFPLSSLLLVLLTFHPFQPCAFACYLTLQQKPSCCFKYLLSVDCPVLLILTISYVSHSIICSLIQKTSSNSFSIGSLSHSSASIIRYFNVTDQYLQRHYQTHDSFNGPIIIFRYVQKQACGSHAVIKLTSITPSSMLCSIWMNIPFGYLDTSSI